MPDTESGGTAAHLGFSVSVAEAANGRTCVTIYGELDAASSPALRKALDKAIEADSDVEIDMRACNFVDSTGIAALVAAARRLHEDGRLLVVRGAQRRVRRIFELAGLLSEHWIVVEAEAGQD